ncbi:MAG: putative disulfide bond formation protein DsbA [Streblomastix strix]|uniref:Putative disulfide bond formation protein DsbA n=1 Tax=Streblomastix strix TaxID=222440 RepID=A0A5J4X0T6_9EUKA|nr:MAG: putative disulfide bond formation protein DsbA [Streblomastix strix]
MAKSLHIDVVQDFNCPWCEVARNRINAALAQIDKSVPLQIIWHPYILIDLPEGGMPRDQYMVKRFGENALFNYAKMADEVAQEGINIKNVCPQMACTIDAHRIVELSLTLGHEKHDKLHEMLVKGYYQEQLDLNNRENLIKAGKSVGLDEAQIRAMFENKEGREKFVQQTNIQAKLNGIDEIPNITINGKYNFRGAASPKELLDAIHKILKGKLTIYLHIGPAKGQTVFHIAYESDSSANHETSQKQGSGHEYMNDLNSVTRWRVSLLSDEERLKVLQDAKLNDPTFDERNADFVTKMKVLMKHIVDQDFKYAEQPPSEASIRKKRKNTSSKIGIVI